MVITVVTVSNDLASVMSLNALNYPAEEVLLSLFDRWGN